MQAISKDELEITMNANNITFSDNEISDDFKVVELMERAETGEVVITLYSAYFMKGPVRLDIKKGSLKITVTEFVDIRKNVWMPVSNWEQYTHHSYTRIHTMKMMLPEDNFCVLRQLIIPEKSFLKVVLTNKLVA